MSDGVSTEYFKRFTEVMYPEVHRKLFAGHPCGHQTNEGMFPLKLFHVSGGPEFGAISAMTGDFYYITHGACSLCHAKIPWEVVRQILNYYEKHRGRRYAGPADFFKEVLMPHIPETERQDLVSLMAARSIANEIYGVFQ